MLASSRFLHVGVNPSPVRGERNLDKHISHGREIKEKKQTHEM